MSGAEFATESVVTKAGLAPAGSEDEFAQEFSTIRGRETHILCLIRHHKTSLPCPNR